MEGPHQSAEGLENRPRAEHSQSRGQSGYNTQDEESKSIYTTTNTTTSPVQTPQGTSQSASDAGHGNAGEEEDHEVTDPVTHEPIMIHDLTSQHMDNLSLHSRSSAQNVSQEQDEAKTQIMEALLEEEMMRARWRDAIERGIKRQVTFTSAAISAGGAAGAMFAGLLWAMAVAQRGGAGFTWFDMFIGVTGCGLLGIGVGAVTFFAIGGSMGSTTTEATGEEKEAVGRFDKKRPQLDFTHQLRSQDPESAAWLNSFLSALWPVVDPGLFTSLADMLEDVMQASLPKFIRGVRVADMGQGSEPIRFLGVRYLTAGDSTVGKEMEEGDYVALEASVAYRARKNSGSLRGRSKNAHLLMEFWTVGGVRLPVWVELTGFLATTRVRLQLTPNPPFLAMMTLTFLGKPKVTMSCVPVAKNFMNVMDIPGLNTFIQSSIDEAMAMYVAPRSLTLDLKEMLVGPDWKTDTEALGILFVRIKHAEGFKNGDGGQFWLGTDGKSGDPYVTVGWGKWGKALWATRIIESEPRPVWEETTSLLVGPAELNAKERLKLQLYDSDRSTADDILGFINVPLDDLMKNPESCNRLQSRKDRFTDENGRSEPGYLYWEVGYFAKTNLEHYISDEEYQKIKQETAEATERKLREAETRREETGELDQQKREELRDRANEMISTRRPHEEYTSGILSIQIHNIVGLQLEKIKDSQVKESEEEESDDLPSPYCFVIINDKKTYRTRTKLKTNKPFFNATTERPIRDWRSTSVIIAVRDSRLHENDALIGVVHLPLAQLFSDCSSKTDFYPLTGGVGFGRVRLSLLFRSVVCKLPRQLLGWDVGTLEILPNASAKDLPEELHSCRLVMSIPSSDGAGGRGKLHPKSEQQQPGQLQWHQKKDKSIHFPLKKRYPSLLEIRFRKRIAGPDQTAAFATLWLKDIPDDEEIDVTVPVYHKHDDHLKRAKGNATHDFGDEIGKLVIRVKFWRGVSPYHGELAHNDQDLQDVMQAVEAMASDGDNEDQQNYTSAQWDESSSSESESDVEEDEKLRNEGKRGLIDSAREYKRNRKELHRKHRGLMQWKGMRTLEWAKDEVEEKAGQVEGKVKGGFRHKGRGYGGVEKEA